MNLDKDSLEVLSDCILSKQEELSKVSNVTKQLSDCIGKELAILRDLNTKVCEELQALNIKSKNTEQ